MAHRVTAHLMFLLLLFCFGNLYLFSLPASSQVTVTPDEFEFPPQQIGISSELQEFIITNESDTSVTLHPGQISIRGKDALGTELSVLSYNIESDDGDWPARFAYILQEVRELEVDVIGLQEVIQRATLDNQAMQMADSLGFYYYFDSVDDEGRDYRFGNAIVSRYPIEETNFRALQPLDKFRKALHTRLDVNGNTVDVYTTHLHQVGLDHDIRKVQITDLLDFIGQTSTGEYIFVTGDFNANPDWEETKLMYDQFADVYPLFHENHLDPEHGTLNPRMGHQQRRIDYVFFNRESLERLVPISAEIILDKVHENPNMESDHFGVFARFELLSDDTDFALYNLEEPLELQPDEQAGIELAFHPQTEGLKEIILSVQERDVPVSGEAFDATVTNLPWTEDFTGADEFQIPFGWNTNAENWYVFNSNHAGGEPPEILFWWEPVSEGRFHLRTPPFRTTGLDSLELIFRHRVDNFQDPGIYDLRLVSMAGGEEYLIAEWPDPDDIPAEQLSFRLNLDEHGVGADKLFLAWVFEGSSDNIVRWSIDDIVLDAYPALAITPDEYDFGRQQIATSSDTILFTMENIGGGIIELEPDDIRIEGEDANSFFLAGPLETVSLESGENIEIRVAFLPEVAGTQDAMLFGGDTFVPLTGESFDPTITEIPWEEDFSELVQGGIPEGWQSDTRNWEAFNLSNAGGEPPEMVFWWQPEKEGRFYLKTPKFDIGSLDSLTLSFKYRVRNFGDPGQYTLSVITIADGVEYVIEEWVDPPFIHPTEFQGLVTRADHGLGSDDFQLAWVFDGITNNISSWDIDDIRLADEPVDTRADSEADLPATFGLEQNYPNPFNPATNITFQVPVDSRVTIEVFDVLGRRVATLVDDILDAGHHQVTFDGTHLASGVYLYRMQTGDFVQTRKLMLVK